MNKATADRGTAVITGVGPALGAALCRRVAQSGYAVAGLARSAEFGGKLAEELLAAGQQFRFYECDITNETDVSNVITKVRSDLGAISTLVHNAGAAIIQPFAETKPAEFRRLWETNCLGGVLAAQAVLPDMLERRSGTMIFTGATAAMRGSANFAAFASAKFALRGLVQSLAREHAPNGIHVAHVIIDGLIWGLPARERFAATEDACLHPNAIAEQYLNLIQQERSAWTQELDLRPFSEEY